ncbi:MAG: MFS transporter [Thalassobius sp.]|nr:MFS transporter [Thalassovita sp.]
MTQTSDLTPNNTEKNIPKIVNAWCSYDWANSVYNLTITATIFPIYFSHSTRAAFGGSNEISFFGLQIENSVLYTYAISFSFLVIVFLSPALSGIADYSGKKKRFMRFFTYTGALACFGLYFFIGENVEWGIFCSVLASIGYAGALVFYNAFLPEIATVDKMDSYSARGYAMGYIGSVILLLINLVIISNFKTLGITEGLATRLSFLQVAIWWFGFAHIALHYLHDRPTGHPFNKSVITRGFHELKAVINKLKNQVNTLRFLISFFFYSMGVQTVMLLAPLFGEKEIHMDGTKLIAVVLILQIVAIIGAYSFAAISKKFGNKTGIAIAVVIWMFICVGGYLLQEETQFYMLAVALGFVMGGIQSLSRSTYSKLIPENSVDTASYFSFYDISEKVAIVLGTFSYGFIEQLTGSMRNSMLAMIGFFLAGLIVILFTRLPKTSA